MLWEAEKEKATTKQQPSSTMSTAGLGFAGLGYVVGGGRGGVDGSGGEGLKAGRSRRVEVVVVWSALSVCVNLGV